MPVAKILAEHIASSTWNVQVAALQASKLIFRAVLGRTADEKMDTDAVEQNAQCASGIDLKDVDIIRAICEALGKLLNTRYRVFIRGGQSSRYRYSRRSRSNYFQVEK